LTINGSTLTTVEVAGVIVATHYTEVITGIDNQQASLLKAYIQNGILRVSGLTVGKVWTVHNVLGICLYQDIANNETAEFSLSVRGMYIVKSENQIVKVIY
jgi:hypothetical protein